MLRGGGGDKSSNNFDDIRVRFRGSVHLVAREGLTWSRVTAERGAVERVVPVLLTAFVAALGLLPLAIGTGLPGQEIEGPMAIVILGGLITSTPLTLLVLPWVAQWLLQPEHFAGPGDIDY